MIRGRSIALGQSSRGMHLSYRLLVSSVTMDWLWSSIELTGNRCMNSAMGLMLSTLTAGALPCLKNW